MKKAILVISFGTSYIEALKSSIERAEKSIRNYFINYDVRRAFTAHRIIKKLNDKYGMDIDTPEEALEKLYNEGYEEVIMQPLHIIPGEEFQYINKVRLQYEGKFKSLKLGRPIFYYQGVEGIPDDYSLFIDAVKEVFLDEEAVVMVGHGTANPSNAVYGCLQSVLEDEGYNNIFVGTVEGYPTIETVIKRVKSKNIKSVKLIPLMLVAGDHTLNDISSDDEGSWKSMLEKAGIEVKTYPHGLGELDSFNKLYITRIEDIIEGRYISIGETKKGHR